MSSRICKFCDHLILEHETMTEHCRKCEKACLVRHKAAVGLALELDDVESIKNVLLPLVEE